MATPARRRPVLGEQCTGFIASMHIRDGHRPPRTSLANAAESKWLRRRPGQYRLFFVPQSPWEDA